MLTSMGTAIGRTFLPGKFYDIEDEEAGRLIAAGFAKPGWEPTIAHLHKHGAGLFVTGSTSPELVEAARAAGLPVHVDETVVPPPANWPEGLLPSALAALEAAGFRPAAIAATSDAALLAVNGVGSSTLRDLRDAFGGPPVE